MGANGVGRRRAPLGDVRLKPGPRKIRFTASGEGRGGGSLVSLDALSLIVAPSRADVRHEVVVDNDELGYEVVSGTWSAATGTLRVPRRSRTSSGLGR
ncbi:hypothetical protein ACWGH8_32265 [Nonomuraea muscovyensis]